MLQGSSVIPTLFNIYMTPLTDVIRSHGLNIISYSDDTQLILSLTKDPSKANLCNAMTNVAERKSDNSLQLNSNKTEGVLQGREH